MKKAKLRGLSDTQLMTVLAEHERTINQHARLINTLVNRITGLRHDHEVLPGPFNHDHTHANDTPQL